MQISISAHAVTRYLERFDRKIRREEARERIMKMLSTGKIVLPKFLTFELRKHLSLPKTGKNGIAYGVNKEEKAFLVLFLCSNRINVNTLWRVEEEVLLEEVYNRGIELEKFEEKFKSSFVALSH